MDSETRSSSHVDWKGIIHPGSLVMGYGPLPESPHYKTLLAAKWMNLLLFDVDYDFTQYPLIELDAKCTFWLLL